ncbi:MAG: hypothetical protein ACOCUS_06085 [Polyangiales bacterium]
MTRRPRWRRVVSSTYEPASYGPDGSLIPGHEPAHLCTLDCGHRVRSPVLRVGARGGVRWRATSPGAPTYINCPDCPREEP